MEQVIPSLVAIELWAPRALFFGALAALLVSSALYYIRNRKQLAERYSEYLARGERTRIIYPAVGANAFFEFVFGKKILSVRSVLAVMGVSATANIVCILIAFAKFPEDFPPIEPEILRIYFYSSVWFLILNFLGDFASLSITRYCLRKIISRHHDLLKYLVVDFGGIALGYAITTMPVYLLGTYCMITSTGLNIFIRKGLLGSAIVPFFYFLLATGGLPPIFGFWAAVAVLSITIPTGIYLTLFLICLVGFQIHERWWKDRSKARIESFLEGIANFLYKILLPLAGLGAAAVTLIKVHGHL